MTKTATGELHKNRTKHGLFVQQPAPPEEQRDYSDCTFYVHTEFAQYLQPVSTLTELFFYCAVIKIAQCLYLFSGCTCTAQNPLQACKHSANVHYNKYLTGNTYRFIYRLPVLFIRCCKNLNVLHFYGRLCLDAPTGFLQIPLSNDNHRILILHQSTFTQLLVFSNLGNWLF